MAELRTFRSRFNAFLPTRELKRFHVRVKWWAFDDDRLGARGDAKLNEANVEVRCEDSGTARKLVVREWGSYATVGTPVEITGG